MDKEFQKGQYGKGKERDFGVLLIHERFPENFHLIDPFYSKMLSYMNIP
jgi:hypothetical protein